MIVKRIGGKAGNIASEMAYTGTLNQSLLNVELT